jgi:hypothetical protein
MRAIALTLMVRPASPGWEVVRSDGRLLARFRGLGARGRALLYARRSSRGVAR